MFVVDDDDLYDSPAQCCFSPINVNSVLLTTTEENITIVVYHVNTV